MKGMFENTTIRNNIVKPYLRSIGADPMGQAPLPDREVVERDACNMRDIYDWRCRVLSAIRLPSTDTIWFYKGAKMCLMYQIWHAAFPDALWIIVRRPDLHIAQSCMRTPFMRAYRDIGNWLLWVNKHKLQFDRMKRDGLDCTEIFSEEIISGHFEGIKSVIESAGLVWRKKLIDEFVDPTLFHFQTRSVTDGKPHN